MPNCGPVRLTFQRGLVISLLTHSGFITSDLVGTLEQDKQQVMLDIPEKQPALPEMENASLSSTRTGVVLLSLPCSCPGWSR